MNILIYVILGCASAALAGHCGWWGAYSIGFVVATISACLGAISD